MTDLLDEQQQAEIALADARVRQAAPEMLKVLNQIDTWARVAEGDKRLYVVEFDSPTGVALRAAIAKAEGL